MLIAKGANVNELDHYQSAPIHCASLHGHKSIIDELVANGSNCSLIGKLSFNEYFKRKFIMSMRDKRYRIIFLSCLPLIKIIRVTQFST